MNDPFDERYLWEREGPADPRVAALERALAPLRFAAREVDPRAWETRRPAGPRRVRRALGGVALAAALSLAAIGLLYQWRFRWPEGAAWTVATSAGAPRIDGARVGGRARLGAGSVLETSGGDAVRIAVARIGRLDVEPGSRLRLVATGGGRHRLALEHGAIAARLWAPPHSFGVTTAASAVYDLGCAFRLAVDDAGAGTLAVTSGWVEIEEGRRETLVPAGATARLYRDGPGSPTYATASPDFLRAVAAVDEPLLVRGVPPPEALARLLTLARPADALTVFHLLTRVPRSQQPAVFERLATLLPPPAGVTRAGVLAGDPVEIDRWWRALGLAPVKRWWVHWRDLVGAGS